MFKSLLVLVDQSLVYSCRTFLYVLCFGVVHVLDVFSCTPCVYCPSSFSLFVRPFGYVHVSQLCRPGVAEHISKRSARFATSGSD